MAIYFCVVDAAQAEAARRAERTRCPIPELASSEDKVAFVNSAGDVLLLGRVETVSATAAPPGQAVALVTDISRPGRHRRLNVHQPPLRRYISVDPIAPGTLSIPGSKTKSASREFQSQLRVAALFARLQSKKVLGVVGTLVLLGTYLIWFQDLPKKAHETADPYYTREQMLAQLTTPGDTAAHLDQLLKAPVHVEEDPPWSDEVTEERDYSDPEHSYWVQVLMHGTSAMRITVTSCKAGLNPHFVIPSGDDVVLNKTRMTEVSSENVYVNVPTDSDPVVLYWTAAGDMVSGAPANAWGIAATCGYLDQSLNNDPISDFDNNLQPGGLDGILLNTWSVCELSCEPLTNAETPSDRFGIGVERELARAAGTTDL